MSAELDLIKTDIRAYLARHEAKELLRFVAVGSVDDGKSTLIGRLLHDAHGVYDDQLEAVRRASSMEGTDIDFSLFTDGLKAEREQGITIDVAYRYFTTEKRKFIIADTPGHVQYTRNMVTGASTADVGVILMDARLGVLEQSRRHAYIASLLGIPHLLVAVNKMDLRDYAEAVYVELCRDFSAFTKGLNFKDVTFVPISALKGDNVVSKSGRMPWYRGPTVLEFLETVPISQDRNLVDFRYPVQYVLRPNLDYRGFAGQIASGVVKKGDPIVVLPSRKTTRVKAIDTYDGERDEAFAPMSVTLRLEHEIDVSRGDMLVRPENVPSVSRTFDAMVVWLHERGLDKDKSYLLKHTSQMIRAQIDIIHARVDLGTLSEVPAETLELNDIGRIKLTCHRPLYFDAYRQNRATGAFVLVDSLTNNTVGAGMILSGSEDGAATASAFGERTQVSPRERRERLGQTGAAVWLSPLGVTGPNALAYALERRLYDLGHAAHVVETAGAETRSAALALKACADAGLIAIYASADSTPADRDAARVFLGAGRFVEVTGDARDLDAAVDRAIDQLSIAGLL
jgi:bifunctional enzyme CysN/CysC